MILIFSLLKNDLFSSQKLKLQPLIITADKEHKIYIKLILDLRINKRQKNLLQYLV